MGLAISTVPATALEKHYSVKEVAELWGLGENTVRRMFEDIAGVLKISQPSIQARKRKPRVTLRIPASVLERAHGNWSAGFGPKVQRRHR